MMDRPAEQVNSSYIARIDPDLCTACGTCAERCQVEAIKELEDVSEVDSPRCIGCGLCVPTCPVEAVSMEKKPDVTPVPENLLEMLAKVSQERGIDD